jgi:hypothetical protein
MMLIHDAVKNLGLPFRKIKQLLKNSKLKPDDQINKNDFAFLQRFKARTEVKELTKAEKKKKIRQREKANDKTPQQENPFAPKGVSKNGKIIVIKTPMGGKVK